MKSPTIFTVLVVSLVLGACANNSPVAPQVLVDARINVRSVELNPAVLNYAPLELKKASDSLSRANTLFAKGEPNAEVSSAAYVAQQQARTALAIAQSKGHDAAIAGAEVERERVRADMRTQEASRARAQTGVAQQQTAIAEERASGAEQVAAQALVGAAQAQQQAGELRQRLADLQANQTERGMLVTLGDVLFELNRAEVKPAAQSSLRKLADFLRQYPTRQVLIEGHTDNTGSAAYNEALSGKRAEAVKAALLGMGDGLASARITTVGYGSRHPISSNNSETDRALNRRVEVYIADNEQPVRPRR